MKYLLILIAYTAVFVVKAEGIRFESGVPVSGDDDTCDRILTHIPHCNIKSTIAPDLSGTWVSRRCEVRPGPEYLLRKYIFKNSTTFEAHQYYYKDHQCTTPLYGIIAKGRMKLRRESWTVPGGTNADYLLSKVSFIPYEPNVADELQRKFNQTCPEMFIGRFWRPYNRYDIHNYIKSWQLGKVIILDQDCTHAVGFNMHELQLIRLEVRSHFHPFYVRKELYLGCLHTNRRMNSQYRPVCYQEPLINQETMGCHVCRRILNSNDYLPPELHRKPEAEGHLDLAGEWVSYRCETRPMGIFVTRRYVFEGDGKTWHGYFYHYVDPLCGIKAFTLYARGTYYTGRRSGVVQDAWNYDFKIIHISVTPNDKSVVRQLQLDRSKDGCGRNGQWELELQQDVTHSQGCLTLGINVPHIEYEIIHLEKIHNKLWLYFGQRPSDIDGLTTPQKRPTSFQLPMVKCGEIETKNTLLRHRHVQRLSRGGKQENEASGTSKLVMWQSLLVICLSFLN